MQIITKSVKGFGSYEYLKFSPAGQLKYWLWLRNNSRLTYFFATIVYNTLGFIHVPNFIIIAVIKAKLWWGRRIMPDWWLKKNPMSNRVKILDVEVENDVFQP